MNDGRVLLLEHAIDGALVLALLDALALVVLLLASGNGNNQLSQSAFIDEQAQRDVREAVPYRQTGVLANNP